MPLYCFYSHTFRIGSSLPSCLSFPSGPEAYGCSLASLAHIEALQAAGEIKDVASVLSGAMPWHCLVCCTGFGGQDLPTRAWGVLKSRFGYEREAVRENPRRPRRDTPFQDLGPRTQPPPYVYSVMAGVEPDIVPQTVRGVVVLQGREDA